MQVTWNFSVTKNGQTCLALHQSSQQDFSLSTSAGTTTTAVSSASANYTVSCPGGASYSASGFDVLGLLSCDAGAFGGLPGTSFDSSATSVSLSLLGAGGSQALGTGAGVPIFNCKK
jgi:hypothetical protein